MPGDPSCVRPALAGLLLASVLLCGAATADGTLILTVGNIRNGRGRIHVDLCRRTEFLKEDCSFSVEAPAISPATTLVLHGIPAGDYAAQATHDENMNGKVDRALFGIPREGVGFSRDARIGLGPPSWKDAMFTFDGQQAHLTFRVRYFLGASGPGGKR